MEIRVEEVPFSRIASFRELYRAEAGCQIVRDSILGRGLADPYLIVDGQVVVGYAGIWNKYTPGRLMEFFVVPDRRNDALRLFAAVLRLSASTSAEAQSNLELQYRLVLDHIVDPEVEKLLFSEGPESSLRRPDLTFRSRTPEDLGPEGEWVVESGGDVVGAGGLLHHYNPPYADLFMEVIPDARGRGIGSFLVQELRRVCRNSGKVPAARCDPTNHASRKALLRGGLRAAGEIVAGSVGDVRIGAVQ